MQSSSRKWHVVYTKPNCERKVAAQLNRKKIIHYYPVNSIQKESKSKAQPLSSPLFSSMVFVYVNPIEQLEVTRASGVVNFMYWLNRPAVIHDDEIEEIRNVMTDFASVRTSKTHVDPRGEMKVSLATLTIGEGNVMAVSKTAVKVSLPSLGYELEADARRSATTLEAPVNGSPAILKIYTRIKETLLS